MIASVRHIAATLALFGVLTITSSTLFSGVLCTDASSCAASVAFGIQTESNTLALNTFTSDSTPATVAAQPSLLLQTVSIMQEIGVLVLTVAVVILVALEAFELYYLKQLFRGKTALRLRQS